MNYLTSAFAPSNVVTIVVFIPHSSLTYLHFVIKDIPDNIQIIYQNTPRPNGAAGASGVGEMPLSGPHAAIVNAIYDACGVRITKLPALPEKVLAGLKKIEQGAL